MDRFIARRNIEHFRRQLAEAQGAETRETLSRLLADAERALRRAEAAHAMEAQAHPGPGADDLAPRPAEARGDAAGRERISGIVEQLAYETAPAQRGSLRRELIEAEDQFADISNRIDIADGHIANGARRIEALEALLATWGGDGDPTPSQLADLNNSREILAIFKSYRAGLAERARRIEL